MKLKAIILVTGLINCIAFSAQAVDSTITVTGNVLQRTCVTPDITVDLGTLYTSDLSSPGRASSLKDAQITLSACQNMTRVQATFSGTPDVDDNAYYKNTGTAGGVKIELVDKASPSVRYSNNTRKTVNVNNGNAIFKLQARAVSKGGVTPGNIRSEITVAYTYL